MTSPFITVTKATLSIFTRHDRFYLSLSRQYQLDAPPLNGITFDLDHGKQLASLFLNIQSSKQVSIPNNQNRFTPALFL